MTILETNLLYVEGGTANSTARTYTAHYETRSDTPTDGPVQHRAALPAMGTALASDPFAVVIGYGGPRPREWRKSRVLWASEVLYSTITGERCQTNLEIDPIQLPAIISGGGTREQRVPREDINGNPIVNAASDEFLGLFIDESKLELVIEQNQSAVDLSQLDDYTNSLNDAVFFGQPAKYWKMEPAAWITQYQGNCSAYYTVTYRFLGNEDLWDLKPANRGVRVRPAPGGDPTNPKDDKGEPYVPSHPIKLKADGTQALAADDPIYYDGQTVGLLPQVGPYEVYKQRDYSLLGIPTALP